MKALPRFLACILLLALVSTRQSAAPLDVIKRSASTSISGSGHSYLPIISQDDRFVVFLSEAKNLTGNDDLSPHIDVFRYDRQTGEMTFVSVNATGFGGGNASSASPSISSNGQFVAYSSTASNLVANDANGGEDIFRRDLVAGTTVLISADVNGNPPVNSVSSQRLSSNPLISADGRFVAFESRATNLIAWPPTTNVVNIFVRDTQDGTTILVTPAADGISLVSTNSSLAGFTQDARYVLFISSATNLTVDAPSNAAPHVYLHDVLTQQTLWVSQTVPSLFPDAPLGYQCLNAAVSENGSAVAFLAVTNGNPRAPGTSAFVVLYDVRGSTTQVIASNAPANSFPQFSATGRYLAYEDSNAIYLWDLQSASSTLVGASPARSPSMSADATKVAYASGPTNGPFQILVRDMTAANSSLVTVTTTGAASSSNHRLKEFALNESGTLVVFESDDPDLVAEDQNGVGDVFCRDLHGAETKLISRRAAMLPATTATGLSAIQRHAISGDGRRVLFRSQDSSLFPGDTNRWEDAFVADLADGTIHPVSLASEGTYLPSAGVLEAVLSEDGKFAALSLITHNYPSTPSKVDLTRVDIGTGEIVTVRSNITIGFTYKVPFLHPSISKDGRFIAYSDLANVYLADVLLNTNYLVSVLRNNNDLDTGGSARSFDPLLSPDGKWLLFGSYADNLLTNFVAEKPSLYLRNLVIAQNKRIGTNVAGDSYQSQSLRESRPLMAEFSANSRFVVYTTTSGLGFRYDVLDGTTSLICTNCSAPSVSADGNLVAYERFETFGGKRDIGLRNLQTGSTTVVGKSIFGTGGGNGTSTLPLISGDGRFVVFLSKASDLVVGDRNGWADIFVYDRFLGTIIRVGGQLPETDPGKGPASEPVLGDDGRTVVFQSFSAHLIRGDYNDTRDVFVLKLGTGDTDNDGMPDDWEVAYFGNLDRDGTADFDHDGHTDLQEYVAGTNPTNENSVLRVLTLTSTSTGQTQLFWSAVPGRTYRVEYKNDLNETTWSAFSNLVTATSSTASVTDTASAFGQSRFYRVVVVQ